MAVLVIRYGHVRYPYLEDLEDLEAASKDVKSPRLKQLRRKSTKMSNPLVGVVMGSNSDWEVMKHAIGILRDFDVTYEAEVVSAHRTPDRMFEYAETAVKRGLKCIIAGAGGAAHLPGMIAAKTTLPVLGVPVTSRQLQGLDSLLSIVQMPKGVPVATFAIGEAGAANAALFAVALLAVEDTRLSALLAGFRETQKAIVAEMTLPPL